MPGARLEDAVTGAVPSLLFLRGVVVEVVAAQGEVGEAQKRTPLILFGPMDPEDPACGTVLLAAR